MRLIMYLPSCGTSKKKYCQSRENMICLTDADSAKTNHSLPPHAHASVGMAPGHRHARREFIQPIAGNDSDNWPLRVGNT